MRTEIEKLIAEQKQFKLEAYDQANELLKINREKLSEEENNLLERQVELCEQEFRVRGIFIMELENLLF